MAERGVPQVVSQRDGLGQVFIQLQGPCNGTRNLGDLDGMGQAGSEQVAFVIDEYLGLVLKASKGRGMDDTVPVTLKFTTVGWTLLRVLSTQGVLVIYGI
jgi:hypothetical protein